MLTIRPGSLAAALVALGALALPAGAAAQPTCTYDAPSGAVALTLDGSALNGAYTLARLGDRIGWLDGRPGAGAAFRSCGPATVRNTDSITVTGTSDADDLVIDLANLGKFPIVGGDGFAPGRTPEPHTPGLPADNLPEIEISVDLQAPSSSDTVEIEGGDHDDSFMGGTDPDTGSTVLTLDGDFDMDLTITRDRSALVLDGNGGVDDIEIGGVMPGTVPYTGTSTIRGGGDVNVLEGGDGPDTIIGGPETDAILGEDGIDTIEARGGGVDHIYSGPGDDIVHSDPFDHIYPDDYPHL